MHRGFGFGFGVGRRGRRHGVSNDEKVLNCVARKYKGCYTHHG